MTGYDLLEALLEMVRAGDEDMGLQVATESDSGRVSDASELSVQDINGEPRLVVA